MNCNKAYFLLLIIYLLLQGCNMKGQYSEEVLTHQTGLQVSIPYQYHSISNEENGLKITINSPDSRNINEIAIKLLDTYQLINSEKKVIDGQTYLYTIENYSGGSGGSEHTITIWKQLENNGVLINHYLQQEGKYDFANTWKLAETVQLNQQK